jgi:hypothetical protein
MLINKPVFYQKFFNSIRGKRRFSILIKTFKDFFGVEVLISKELDLLNKYFIYLKIISNQIIFREIKNL